MKVGRNQGCHCGSGRKFKRCHGAVVGRAKAKSGSAEPEVPFDYMVCLLTRVIPPQLLVMRKAALVQWCEILLQWTKEEAGQATKFDTVRLERLVQTALQTAQSLLRDWDPRFSVQAVRSLPNRLIPTLCQFEADETERLAKMLHTLSAVAATASGMKWPRSNEEDGTAIALEADHLRELELSMPQILGRFVGACNLLASAQNWYRCAGKGMLIASFPPPESFRYEAIERWNGRGLLIVPSIELTRDKATEQAMAAYDERRRKSIAGIGRAGLLRPARSGCSAEPRHRLWLAVLGDPCRPVLPISIPSINLVIPAPNYYPMPHTEWQQMVTFIGTHFEPQLQARFGLSSADLESGLAALGHLVERQTRCGNLSLGHWRENEALVLNSPAMTPLSKHSVSRLVSVLRRGTLRAQGASFRSALALELRELGANDETLTERFFRAFCGVTAPVGFSKPILFWEQDESTCVHDLTRVDIFLEDLLSTVIEGDGPVANNRADVFEEQTRRALRESLSLVPERMPWAPNRDVYSGGRNFGDVDFCFSVGDVLINLDMKSWQRTSDSFIGHHHTIQDRCRTLVQQLVKTEKRGGALLAKLNADNRRYQACLSLLIVATPEYLDPCEAKLWFGQPTAQPRVLTVEELKTLVTNQERWCEVVRTATENAHILIETE